MSDEYDEGYEDGYKAGYKSGWEEGNSYRRDWFKYHPPRPTKRKALRIVRLLLKHYQWGDSNDTLAYVLQNEMEKEK